MHGPYETREIVKNRNDKILDLLPFADNFI